jgi:hypothetical protein
MRMRRGRKSTRRTAEEAQQHDDVQQKVEQQPAVDVAQHDDDDSLGSGASGSRNVYLRGPASLPQRPILRDRRSLIRLDGERHVTFRCSRCLFILCVQIHNVN